MKKYSKEEAIAAVVKCAELYRSELEGKNLLFFCYDKTKRAFPVEASFYGNNYMHLTGLKARRTSEDDEAERLSANGFYQKCLDHKLSPSDFDFSNDGTTHMKLDMLPKIICKNLNARMLGDYNSLKPHDVICKGWFLPPNTYDCGSFVVN